MLKQKAQLEENMQMKIQHKKEQYVKKMYIYPDLVTNSSLALRGTE